MPAITISGADGYALGAHLWRAAGGNHIGTVIINPATGVLARYYHPYARFLADNGFDAVTYDYRGIGASRPAQLRGSGIRWHQWGTLDFDAVVRWAREHDRDGLLVVVGHSIGGFLPGFAESAPTIDRLLTMGAQYAYWRDYDARQRMRLFLKWHVAMPLLTLPFGYFPGRRLQWLEDLPAGVVREWSFRRARMERNLREADRTAILTRFAAVTAPILALGLTDDELGTTAAIRRGLDYYRGAERRQVLLKPQALGFDSIGHFGLFHSRHRDGFWAASLAWLRDGTNPWPAAVVDARPPEAKSDRQLLTSTSAKPS